MRKKKKGRGKKKISLQDNGCELGKRKMGKAGATKEIFFHRLVFRAR
jgi:hypothetical protein